MPNFASIHPKYTVLTTGLLIAVFRNHLCSFTGFFITYCHFNFLSARSSGAGRILCSETVNDDPSGEPVRVVVVCAPFDDRTSRKRGKGYECFALSRALILDYAMKLHFSNLLSIGGARLMLRPLSF